MAKKKDQINTFLGVDTEFEGKLTYTGAVRIDGRFKGEIFTEGTLIVGEMAVIEAEIRVSHIAVSGTVRGNIVANNKIEMHVPGKVLGNISAPVITIAEGVIFEGNCRMQDKHESVDKKVAVLSQ